MDGQMTILDVADIASCACELCGGRAETRMRGEGFTYGAGADAVVLSATVPVTSCVDCGEAYTGEEGEILRHEAVCVHLGRLTPLQITTIRGARTAEQLAEAGGFDLDAVRRWERGNRIQDAASDLVLRGLGEAA
jgi:hypothetical protein